jgi:Flp pilus assembly protein TadD
MARVPQIIALLISAAFALAAPARAVDTVSDGNADLSGIRAMIKAKDYQGAMVLLRNLAGKGDSGKVLNLLAFCLRKTGNLAEAHTLYLRAIALEPDLKSAHEYLGELYVQTGERDKAREHLRILERLCPAGCEELDDLREALDTGNTEKKQGD